MEAHSGEESAIRVAVDIHVAILGMPDTAYPGGKSYSSLTAPLHEAGITKYEIHLMSCCGLTLILSLRDKSQLLVFRPTSKPAGRCVMRLGRICGAILCVVMLLEVPAIAQSQSSDTDWKILLDKVKADKKLVVASNMELTESEKMTFWPIYDAYQKDLQAINDRMIRTITEYANAYNNRSITDEQARKLTNDALAIEADEVKLRSSYAGKLNLVLPAKTVARYIQIESKIRAILRYDMASAIPLVP
jgi:hypothetical protein